MSNFYEIIARRKLSVGPEWRWCNLQAIGPDATKIEGGVPKMRTRGPRKGSYSWRGIKLDVCVVTDAEMRAEKRDYESFTGNCHHCLGEKQTVAGVSRENGTTYMTCNRCKGTGLAP